MSQLIDLGTNFTGWDWAIVAAYLVGTVVIGLYANRYIENMSDYIVAGRSLKSSLGIATMLGSEIGLVTVMYAAQKGFTAGFAAFHIGLVAGLVPLIVGLTGFLVVPLRRLNVMTIPEFYELRFGKGVRILGGTILALVGIVNMGVFLRAGALFVAGLTGMSDPQEPSSFKTHVDRDFLERLIKIALHRAPLLEQAEMLRGWAGLYAVTPDENPIIGPISGREGLYCAIGFSGHGFQHGPAVGYILSQLITKGKTSFDLSSFSHLRFKQKLTKAEKQAV